MVVRKLLTSAVRRRSWSIRERRVPRYLCLTCGSSFSKPTRPDDAGDAARVGERPLDLGPGVRTALVSGPPAPPRELARDLPSSTITPTMIPTQMVAGLTMIVREVEGGAPELDPIHFVTKQGESFDTLNMGKGDHFTFHWLDTVPMSLEVDSGKDKYVAQETYNNDGTKGQVILTRNGREIYRIDTGHGSPISALQGLWVYDNHWLLETNYYLDDMPFNGKITQDGILLNDTNDYEEAFGFQTINGLPFYFFKKKGLFDAWYDGEVISLGYEQIPHYSCCSSAELNPQCPQEHGFLFWCPRGYVVFRSTGCAGCFLVGIKVAANIVVEFWKSRPIPARRDLMNA